MVRKIRRQLSYVLLDGVWINRYGDRNQGVQGKIKDLVAEEWDDPGRVLLVCSVRSHDTDKDHENRNRDGNAHVGIIHELNQSHPRVQNLKSGNDLDQPGRSTEPVVPRIEDQVPDAEQDGAGADTAAQTAAVGVESRPRGHHLHRSGRGRSGATLRPSSQELRPSVLLPARLSPAPLSPATLAPSSRPTSPGPRASPREELAAVVDF